MCFTFITSKIRMSDLKRIASGEKFISMACSTQIYLVTPLSLEFHQGGVQQSHLAAASDALVPDSTLWVGH